MISKRSSSTVDGGDGGADAAWLVHVRRPTMQVYRRRDIFDNMVTVVGNRFFFVRFCVLKLNHNLYSNGSSKFSSSTAQQQQWQLSFLNWNFKI